MTEKKKRTLEMLNCGTCGATGEWVSPEVRRTDNTIMSAETFPCLSCDGTGLVEREIDEVELKS